MSRGKRRERVRRQWRSGRVWDGWRKRKENRRRSKNEEGKRKRRKKRSLPPVAVREGQGVRLLIDCQRADLFSFFLSVFSRFSLCFLFCQSKISRKTSLHEREIQKHEFQKPRHIQTTPRIVMCATICARHPRYVNYATPNIHHVRCITYATRHVRHIRHVGDTQGLRQCTSHAAYYATHVTSAGG